jgi:predicted acylesterase/phospholipase RssA/CRP-like cAMP-binding protein
MDSRQSDTRRSYARLFSTSDNVRRVAEAVEEIEAHVARVRQGVRAALTAFLEGGTPASKAPEPVRVAADDLDRYASEWAWLVPSGQADRAHLADRLASHLGPRVLQRPHVREALGLPALDAFEARSDPPASETAVDALEQAAEYVVIKGGETLMREGDPSDSLFVVLSGRLVAAQAAQGGERVLGEILSGTTIGELGALTGVPRSARVFALRDSHLLRIPAAAFSGILARFPEVLRGVVQTMISREREVDRRPRLRTIAVVPLSGDVPVQGFVQELAHALGRFGAARSVARAEAEDGLKHNSGWLTRLEEQSRFVVLQSDAHASPWTERCVRQADRILLVGQGQSDGHLSAIERLIADARVSSTELVLLYPSHSSVPRNTRSWLGQRQLAAHHHVRQDSVADLQRLARRLAGRAVGVVFGGGGARAFAHIGAIRAFEEIGVPIDVVGGVSAGAIVAAQYAFGWGPNELSARDRAIATQGRKLIDYTLPLVALIQARKFTSLLDHLFGDAQIEDLRLPFWCLSSNLTRAEKIVHRTGRLAQAVRASCALPGVVPPVLVNGDVVVDGGLIDTVPVTTMREVLEGGGFILAIDVSAEIDLARPYAFGSSVSGLRILWERVNPFGTRTVVAPSLADVLVRSVELASVMARHGQEQADLFIKPPVAHVDRLAFDLASFDELVEVGYQQTRAALCDWPRLAEVRGG